MSENVRALHAQARSACAAPAAARSGPSGRSSPGNPTTYSGVAAAYDAENRLTSFGSALSAIYDMSGRRAAKTTSAGTTYYLYDGIQPVCELNGSGTVTAVNTFGANGLLSRTAAGSTVYYQFDSQGSVVQRLNASGASLNSAHFTAFGAGVWSNGVSDVFGYRGQQGYYTDPETGLCLLTHRYYDPVAGRFLPESVRDFAALKSRDPISLNGGINLYAYVHNRPSRLTDVQGHAPSPWCLIPCIPCASCGVDFAAVCSDCGLDASCWGNCVRDVWNNLPPWMKWGCGLACGGCIGCLIGGPPEDPVEPPTEPPCDIGGGGPEEPGGPGGGREGPQPRPPYRPVPPCRGEPTIWWCTYICQQDCPKDENYFACVAMCIVNCARGPNN